MPGDAPRVKVEATRAHGAEIVTYDRMRDDREAVAAAVAQKTGRVLVPPFDDYAIMAGQGTAALELLTHAPDLDVLVGPVGGGGLMAGCTTAARGMRPDIRTYGVEAEGANDAQLSLRSGERVTIAAPTTIADGIRTTSLGRLTFPILRARLDDVLIVSDDEIRSAMGVLARDVHLVAEPTGAVALAAVLSGRLPVPKGSRVGVIVSGGNVDPELLSDVVRA
jgi:threonine dehydratase